MRNESFEKPVSPAYRAGESPPIEWNFLLESIISAYKWLWHRPLLGFLVVFCYATWLRWQLPFVTILSGESFGYLSPAISALCGDGFNQSLGQGMAYPLFLLTILKLTSSFPAIVITQHLIGVLSGILWMIVFRLWSLWLPESIAGSTWLKWICSLFLCIHLCNGQNIVFESMIVPEAIFPFCVLAELALTMAYVRLRWAGGHDLSLIACGAGSMLIAVICYGIMPTSGLAAFVPALVLTTSVFKRSFPYIALPSVAAIFCGLGLVYAWSFEVPRLTGWVVDGEEETLFYTNSITDVPAKIFTVHADIISEHLHKKLDRNVLNQDEKRFLENFDRRLGESKNDVNRDLALLGHNPDYLMYPLQSDALTDLPGDANASLEKRKTFLLGMFLEAATDLPYKYGQKVRNQIYEAFRNANRTLYKDQLSWRPELIMSNSMFRYFRKANRLPAELKASFEASKNRNQELAEISSPVIYVSFSLDPNIIEYIFSRLLIVFTFGSFFLTIWATLSRHSGIASEMRSASLAFLVIVSSSFGMILTIAGLSSFSRDRSLASLSAQFSILFACGNILIGLLAVRLTNQVWYYFFESGSWKSEITPIKAEHYGINRRSSPMRRFLKKVKRFFIR